MTAVLLALILIVLFFALSQSARAQVRSFLVWAFILILVVSIAGIVYLRSVVQQRQAQEQVQQEAVRREWLQSGPHIVIDHRSEIFAHGATSVAFQQQCPNISVTESDALGRSDVPDEVAYRVSFDADYRNLSRKVGNMKVSHEGVIVYAGSGSLQTLAKNACDKITGKSEIRTKEPRTARKAATISADQGDSPPPPESTLSSEERASLESACSHAKYIEGPAAYNRCIESQLRLLATVPQPPDLSSLNDSEKQSIESVCSRAKYVEGPAAYNRCLQTQLTKLASAPRRPDLSGLSQSEKESIESACSHAKYLEGPAAYNRCLLHQLELLGNRRP